MEALSIFDIFSIGVGPSSSHTLGPWRAALHFLDHVKGHKVIGIKVHLYGSLSKTGKGHATDKAVLLGLMGYDPITIDTLQIDEILEQVKQDKKITVNGAVVSFDFAQDIIFENYENPNHPNTLLFIASTVDGIFEEMDYTSVGGGFIEVGAKKKTEATVTLPYQVNDAADLAKYTEDQGCNISDIVYQNELVFNPAEKIDEKIAELAEVMLNCVYQGCTQTGTLPGGLGVRRRANKIMSSLVDPRYLEDRETMFKAIKTLQHDFTSINKFVSCFALAVNEENASMNRVVTSPTNGAAGVIPAVLLHHLLFNPNVADDAIKRFLLTAGEIGSLFKKKATISAAVGGCQAEIGVSSAMAAAALTELNGGSPMQALMAAEIAMEHHLGLTCDPIAGLVQVPCIERNAMGAIKAITASNLALMSNADEAIVKLDWVIEAMWDTAKNMNSKYKETSEGGLAIHTPVSVPSC